MNACPCGFLTDAKKECHCTPNQIQKYLSKVSGPLLFKPLSIKNDHSILFQQFNIYRFVASACIRFILYSNLIIFFYFA
ncbi:MAG: ATP-binding protein [Candidatus Omnitrophica bacterium]|nr:ATP-binding protein [Candidatus Omnitrophota bacterium]